MPQHHVYVHPDVQRTPPKVLFRVFDCSDLASHLLQWCDVKEIGRMCCCCRRLSIVPFQIRFSVWHAINAESFITCLNTFEMKYDKLVKKLRRQQCALFGWIDGGTPVTLPAPPSLTVAGRSVSCDSDNYSKSINLSRNSSWLSCFPSRSSSFSSATTFRFSSSFSSRVKLLASDCVAHSRYCLRSLRLCNFYSVVVQLNTAKDCEILSQLTFLRSHLIHFQSIRILSAYGHVIITVHGPSRQCFLPAEDLPSGLTELRFKGIDRLTNADFPLPSGIQKLHLGLYFSGKFVVPPHLRILTLNDGIAHQFQKGELPDTLEEVRNYTQCPMPGDGVLPNSLKILQFSASFQRALLPGSLPTELHTLILSFYFSELITEEMCFFPSKLHTLIFSNIVFIGVDHTKCLLSLPSSLRVLQFPAYFHQPTQNVQFCPEGLTALDLGGFRRPLEIGPGTLPSTLTTLYLPRNYSESLQAGVLPCTLRHLAVFGNQFLIESLANPGVIPNSLQWLGITRSTGAGSSFMLISKNPNLLPANLLELRIWLPRASCCIKEFEIGHVADIRKSFPKLKIRWFRQQLAFIEEEEEVWKLPEYAPHVQSRHGKVR